MVKRVCVLLAAVTLVALQLLVTVGSAAAAGPEYFTATLSGGAEVPPVVTTATGSATFIIDPSGTSILYDVSYQGLSGPAAAAHIHVGAASVAAGIILPLQVGPSPMVGILTAADLTPSGSVTTFAEALDAIRAGNTYVNIHTAANKPGEIRGQIGPAPLTPAYTVMADAPQAVPKDHLWSFNDFFPRTSTIAQGATVLFLNQGFHTFTLLPAGMTVAADNLALGVATPDPDDTVRNPNGTTHANFNVPATLPALPAPGCGSLANPCAFDGTAVLNSGVSLAGPSEPLAVKVTAAPGAYEFHCRIHALMTGTLNVVAPGSTGTTTVDTAAAATSAQLAAEVPAAFAVEAAGSKAAVHRNPNGTRTWTLRLGASTPDGRVALLEFLPRKLHIRRGDTVVFRPTDRNEPHTVTFPTDMHTDLVPLCEGTGGTDTPAAPIVNPPTSPLDFACSGHPPDEIEFDGGNGVHTLTSPKTVSDSGLVAYRTIPQAYGITGAALPSWWVRVAPAAKTGVYTYVCQIHDGMEATLTVTK
jgi:plastocyanin